MLSPKQTKIQKAWLMVEQAYRSQVRWEQVVLVEVRLKKQQV